MAKHIVNTVHLISDFEELEQKATDQHRGIPLRREVLALCDATDPQEIPYANCINSDDQEPALLPLWINSLAGTDSFEFLPAARLEYLHR